LSNTDPTHVARDILSYFLRNPHAADDVEGITRWRLLQETVHRTVGETRAALAWLVRRGFLVQTSRAGLAPIFTLNADNRGEAARFLAPQAPVPLAQLGPSSDEAKMPATTLDDMASAGLWTALAPDGVTPSTELALAVDTTRARLPGDTSSAQVSATANALNHTLRRNLGPVDLGPFNEIRLWVNSDRPADGTVQRRFYLEMRLASAALALNDPNNKWQRYLPVSQVATWEPVRLTLGDLPAAVRGALTTIQFRCASPTAFHCNIDRILAVRDAMISDVDDALRACLDGILSVNGAPIPAVVHPANGVLDQARPYIEILHYDAHYSRERTDSVPTRGDFTDQGYSVRPATNAYELYYQVTAVSDDRPTQSAMLEFILRTLPARGQLPVNGCPLPMEAVTVQPIDQIGGFRTDQIPLFYKISTRQEVGPATRVQPATTVILNADFPSP
jgi:hypothetical protein